MNAGRQVGTLGMAAGAALAVGIGLIAESVPPRSLRLQDDARALPLVPVVQMSVRNDVSSRLDSMAVIEPDAGASFAEGPYPAEPNGRHTGPSAGLPRRDPVAQTWHGLIEMPAPLVSFDGVNSSFNGSLPDVQGDVGPGHYVQWANRLFAIFDRSGNKIYPAGSGFAVGATLWTDFGGPCASDGGAGFVDHPTVKFDRLAQRWLMSRSLAYSYTVCVAISQTADPTGAWYRYAFEPFSGQTLDHPTFGVWPDGYYMTVAQPAAGFSNPYGARVSVFERDRMLAGQPARQVYFDLSAVDPKWTGLLPSDLDGTQAPPAGSPNYLMAVADGQGPSGADVLQVFRFHTDWVTPANSTITGPAIINLTSLGLGFKGSLCNGSWLCIPQPDVDTKLQTQDGRLMYRLAYRNFGTHESLVLNHTVDVDGTSHAGIRWYEVRSPGTTPTVFQAGTFAPDADHRWVGSIAMDASGNIALGYSVSSRSTYPSIRYAGRLAGDPPGQLTQREVTLMAGMGSDTFFWWGDNSIMSVDPLDDCTFWYTQAYNTYTGQAPWVARVGSFRFPTCTQGQSGTLAGTVTDNATGLPIPGARIQLGTSTETVTSADGSYRFLALAVGTYTLTLSKPTYVSQVFSNVVVTGGATTTRNAALVAAMGATVSGVVRDGSGHGWPLYARIDIEAFPANTVYTNPATGQYSISLWSGATYTVTATPLVEGYQPLVLSASPTGTPASATVNFDLAVDVATCAAPGYASQARYSADFEANDGGYVALAGYYPQSWAWGIPASGPNRAHSGSNAWATNLTGYYNNSEDGSLTSPVIDLAAYAGQAPILSWWQWLQTEFTYDFASVEVSKDGGTTWSRVYGPISGNVDLVWTKHTVALDASYAVPGFRLRFILRPDSSVTFPGWYVDEVGIAVGCSVVPGGLVTGTVVDANAGTGLAGATVTSVANPAESTTAVATAGNPGLPGGFYQVFSSSTGSVSFDAAKVGGFGMVRASVPVVANQTVRHDFQLPAGRILAQPGTVTERVAIGTTSTRTFTLTNTGTQPADFQIRELRPSAPARPADPQNDEPTRSARENTPRQSRADVRTAAGLASSRPLEAPPYAAGDVIQSWWSGVASPWGIAFDGTSGTVWIASPVPAWGGSGLIKEFSASGVATERQQPYTWSPSDGPADGAFDWNTGRLWVANLDTTQFCIYEIDPRVGATGKKLCPYGNGWLPYLTHGVAYDPATDTWYAGSWETSTVYHFSSTGTVLDSKPVGLAISGLAYNPTTHHLFTIVNAATTTVYVLDTANDYAVVGQFPIAGFGAFASAGLEIGCNGHLWAINQIDGKTYEIDSGETTTVCQTDTSWLSASPMAGTLTPPGSGSQVVTLTLDARASAGITQPGAYQSNLAVVQHTPYALAPVAVTMNVFNPSTAPGEPTGLAGTVTGSSLTLTWQAPALGGTPTTYMIEAGTWPGGSNLGSFPTGNTLTTFTANGLADGPYWIRMKARNAFGTSAASNEIQIQVGLTPPGQPTGLTASATGSSIALSWSAPATGGAPSEYIISAGSGRNLSDLARFSTGSTATSYFASGVAAGGYWVRVQAQNVKGTGAPSSDVELLVGPGTPGTPGSLSVSSAGSSITMSWQAPTTGGPPATYVIEAGNQPGSSNLANFPTGNTQTTYSASGVVEGTYFVRVRAANAGGTGPATDASYLVVGCLFAPNAPSGLHTNLNNGGTVTLGWTAPVSSAFNDPTTYVLEAGSSPGAANLALLDLGGVATTYTVYGVPAGTYYVRVKARNKCGTGPASNEFVLVMH